MAYFMKTPKEYRIEKSKDAQKWLTKQEKRIRDAVLFICDYLPTSASMHTKPLEGRPNEFRVEMHFGRREIRILYRKMESHVTKSEEVAFQAKIAHLPAKERQAATEKEKLRRQGKITIIDIEFRGDVYKKR